MIGRAPFGSTGHQSSRAVFGAASLWAVSQEQADEILAVLLAHGVNHIDVAASYGDAELRVGPWMAEHRAHFFLATKTGDRSGDAARASIERSLTRLQVDRVDMIQLHDLVEEEEWAEALGPRGALAALVRAHEEGLVRFIGVTGHGMRIARMHLRSLQRHDFDSVLFPYNHALLADGAYRADVEELLAVCAERGVAAQAIKSVARRRWPGDPHNASGPPNSWYQPLDDPSAIGRAVAFALARPGIFLVTPGDFRILPAVLEAAGDPGPAPAEAELEADAQRLGIRPLFDGGELERI